MQMTNMVAIDIETTLDEQVKKELTLKYVAEYREIQKSKFTMDEYIQNKMQESFVNVNLVKPIAIGLYSKNLNIDIGLFNLNTEQLLNEFITVINKFDLDNVAWTGFNIINFDFPVLALNMIKHNIYPKAPFLTTKSWNTKELRDVYKIGKLNEILSILNIEGKFKGYTGKDVEYMLQNKLYDDILNYVKQDAKIEYLLAEKTYKIYK